MIFPESHRNTTRWPPDRRGQESGHKQVTEVEDRILTAGTPAKNRAACTSKDLSHDSRFVQNRICLSVGAPASAFKDSHSDLLSIPSASSRRSIVRRRSFPRARETRSRKPRLTAARAFFASSRKMGKDGNS